MSELVEIRFEELKKRLRSKHDDFVKEIEEALNGCEKRASENFRKSS